MARRLDTYLKGLISEDQYDFYSAVRDFGDKEVAPHILQWERDHDLLPQDCIDKMGELGLFGLPIEEDHGGQGGNQTDLILMGLALGYHSHSVAITPGAAISLGAKPLQLFGTDAQKAAHLPDLAAGKRMFVFGLSEPGHRQKAGRQVGHPRREVLVHQRTLGEPHHRARADLTRRPQREALDLLPRPDGCARRKLQRDEREEGLGAIQHWVCHL